MKMTNKNKEEWLDNIDYFDENIILNLVKWLRCQIIQICSYIGGIAAQEIIKKSGKL